MSRMDPASAAATAATLRGLRGASFGAVVMLLVQYSLGIWVEIYGHLPASDRGKGILAAVGAAVTGGPVALSVHAVLGLGLLVAGLSALVRAVLLRRTAWIVVAGVALVALAFAAINGARFVGGAGDEASMGMALAAGLALLCYAVVLFAAAPGSA